MQYIYAHGVLGGTFDQFHKGHEALLTHAFEQSEQVTIGLSLPVLYQHKLLSRGIDPYAQREAILKRYLVSNNYMSRAIIVPIDDIYGTTLLDASLDAIFVTETTKPNAILINIERKKKQLPLLQIVTVPFVKNDDGVSISSEAIRKGEIDGDGMSYYGFFRQKKQYVLPDTLRESFHKPIGSITTDIQAIQKLQQIVTMLITVGDITTISLLKNDIFPSISIVDLKTRRHILPKETVSQYFPSITPIFSNPPGTINTAFTAVFQKAIENNISSHKAQTIVVNGEEDLLALPVMLLAPLNSLLIYGQYDKGMVIVPVTKERKIYAKNLLSKF